MATANVGFTCQYQGEPCGRPAHTKLLCSKHYQRVRRVWKSGRTAEERYERKVDRSGGPEACHPWLAGNSIQCESSNDFKRSPGEDMEARDTIAVLIPAHPARLRSGYLARAVESVFAQTLVPDEVHIVVDKDRLGAGAMRSKLINDVKSTYVAWIDSDDRWDANHLETLYRTAKETDSVYVYSWFRGVHDPLGHFGKTFDPCNPHHTTIVALVLTELAKEVGFRVDLPDGPYAEEDWGFITGISKIACERGLKMTHVPLRTWHWEQGPQNSSGRPGQGDAA